MFFKPICGVQKKLAKKYFSHLALIFQYTLKILKAIEGSLPAAESGDY